MALYIHEENQQILWRLFDKLPYIINNPRKHVLPNHKETIFKETIEYFYERNKMHDKKSKLSVIQEAHEELSNVDWNEVYKIENNE